MQINQRVSAILITPANELVLVKHPGSTATPYWTVPGVTLADRHSQGDQVLSRELQSISSNTINITRPVFSTEHILEEDVVVQQAFYLCYLAENRFIPRASDSGQPLLTTEIVALKPAALKKLNIQPEKLKVFLLENGEKLLALQAIR
jgi:hypothetical protein